MQENSHPRLLGDVGGTNARFAWQDHAGTPLSGMVTYSCAHFASLLDAGRYYLAAHDHAAVQACATGIANPVTADQVRMTNHHWSFSINELRSALGARQLVVINDFTAIALSLPDLAPHELHRVGGGHPVEGAPRAVLGPGTGLGVSGLLHLPSGQTLAIDGEGGHATLAALDLKWISSNEHTPIGQRQ